MAGGLALVGTAAAPGLDGVTIHLGWMLLAQHCLSQATAQTLFKQA